MSRKIKVVYHCYLVGDWRNIVSSQLLRLKTSGLYDSATDIFVTVNLNDSDKDEFYDVVKNYNKLKIEFSTTNTAEYLGIKKVKEITSEDDCNVLYFHTKGVSNTYQNLQNKQISEEKINNIRSWRECLEYFLIDKWKDCILHLNEYDNVGVTCNNKWYWGNFWWSKSYHIRKTKPVEIWGRWEYENWLNDRITDSKNFEWYHFNFNPYLTYIHQDWYKNKQTNSEEQKILLRSAFYGTPDFQIDEGYSFNNLNQGKDVTDIVKLLLEKENFSKFNFVVSNDNLGGDAVPMVKKFLIVTFSYTSNPNKLYKIGIEEGQNFKFI